MAIEEKQTKNFIKTESIRNVKSYLKAGSTDFSQVFSSLGVKNISNILDVGCASGHNLKVMMECFDARSGVGVEPSQESVDLLEKTHSNNLNIKFKYGEISNLPFESDSFDIVSCWSVLHWVGRNEYLRAISEIIRCSKKYVLIMDFHTIQDYKVPYRYKKGLYTYKSDFEKILMNVGFVKPLKRLYWIEEFGVIKFLECKDFDIFENRNNFHGRKMVLFQKDFQFLRQRKENDFD